jgi:uncharacterized membrane protein YdbT with pleckstrin-like domain
MSKSLPRTPYVESTLLNGEKIIYVGRLSLWTLAPKIILGIVAILLGVGISFIAAWMAVLPILAGVASLLTVLIRYNCTELAITNKRVVAKFGIIGRNTIELSVQKIESVRVYQSVVGRIFNFGSIILAGAGNPQEPIIGISNPMEFRKFFM